MKLKEEWHIMQAAKTINIQSHLAHMESVTKKKIRKKRILYLLASVFILVELAVGVMLFKWIFEWYIKRDLSYNYMYLLAFILGVNTVLLLNKGLFRLIPTYSFVSELFQLIKIAFLTFMITAGVLFLMKVSIDFSRIVIGFYFVGLLSLSWIVRLTKRAVIRLLTYSKVLARNVLIIGAGNVGNQLYEHLSELKTRGYRLIGFLDDHKNGPEVKGRLSDIESVIAQNEVDEVIVTLPSKKEYIYTLIKNIQKHKVKVKIIPELYNIISARVGYDQLDPYPFLEVSNIQTKSWHGLAKRTLDIVLSVLAIIILSPLLFLLWTLVKLDSRGPAVFKQIRIGINGTRFHIYKFRSMVTDAEIRLKEDPELYRKYLDNNYKLEPEQDPRITKLGRFLRRTSLDELPQLFNVLKGEMSLVGPRPVVEEELQEYDQLLFDFLSVKPGVTGYWQVSGRSNAGYPERVDIELYYVYNQSLTLDFKIMFRTVGAVLKRKGAY
ncbi:sugar transferase [Paenibacillaceae bacterium WGS1546]|uniref:sugar transferase n=1 Tax=Cohnella sp. WGS1546 TaxID=3366810 RepID=UPI00372D41F7